MELYVGLDVSLKETSICVMDRDGTVVAECIALSDPDAIADCITSEASGAVRIGFPIADIRLTCRNWTASDC